MVVTFKRSTLLFSLLGMLAQVLAAPGPPENGFFDLVSASSDHLAYVRPGSEDPLVFPLSDNVEILGQSRISPQDMEVGDTVIVRGDQVGPNQISVMLMVVRENGDGRGFDGARGFVAGTIADTSPLKMTTAAGDEVELEISPHANVFRENRLDWDDLRPGSKIKLFENRVLVIAEAGAHPAPQSTPPPNGRFGSNGGEHQPSGQPSLPMAPSPEEYEDRFDPEQMAATESNPFGFFDPNMLRSSITSWYNDYAEVASELGAGWVSFGATFSFNWNLVQERQANGELGVFRWERWDNLVRHAHAHNLNIVGYIKSAEPVNGAVGRNNRPRNSLPKDLDAYKRFVAAVIERYDGDGIDDMPGLRWPIRYWSIEDEPMAPVYFDGDGADYARLLHAAFTAAKSANPDVKIICSMILRTGAMPKDKQLGLRTFMVDFFSTLRDMGVERPYDIMDHHWLGKTPGTRWDDQFELFRKWMEEIDRTTREYGFEPTPYVDLEMGSKADTPEDHAAGLVKRHVVQLALGVRILLWSGIRAAPDNMAPAEMRNGYFHRVTLIDGDDSRKRAFYAYKLMTKVFTNTPLDSFYQIKGADGVYLFRFQYRGRPAWIGWYDGDDGPYRIRLDVGGNAKLRLVEAIPTMEDGRTFKNKTVETAGALELELTNVPLYVLTF